MSRVFRVKHREVLVPAQNWRIFVTLVFRKFMLRKVLGSGFYW